MCVFMIVIFVLGFPVCSLSHRFCFHHQHEKTYFFIFFIIFVFQPCLCVCVRVCCLYRFIYLQMMEFVHIKKI